LLAVRLTPVERTCCRRPYANDISTIKLIGARTFALWIRWWTIRWITSRPIYRP